MIQSPLWSINIMNGTSLWFDDIYVNNTALDAAYVSCPFACNVPCWDRNGFCRGNAKKHV